MKNKIGLAIVTDKVNYGTILQAYATQKALNDMGYDTEAIATRGFQGLLNRKKGEYFAKNIFQKDLFWTKKGLAVKKILEKVNWQQLGTFGRIRKRAFQDFIRGHMRFSPAFETLSDLTDYSASAYHSVIVGSDQLWLPPHIEGDYYTLNWVPRGVQRLSYATSFGVSDYPAQQKERVSEFLSRLDGVSVREERGAELVKKYAGREAEILCDPTMLLTPETWLNIAAPQVPREKYIFCYFLGRNPWQRDFAVKLRELTGYKIVAILHMDEYIPSDANYADETPYNANPCEFIRLIHDAEYVCTDSFHGSIFSILFQKRFFSFKRFEDGNRMSTNSRMETLLKTFSLESRLISRADSVDGVLDAPIDFSLTEAVISDLRKRASEWLMRRLGTPHRISNVTEKNRYDCCGCTACVQRCPAKCLEMRKDAEGFSYPVFTSAEACVHCGKCLKVCPVEKYAANPDSLQKAYLAQNLDRVVRDRSTSGGFFTAVAERVISAGGIVYGAAFDKNLTVRHVGVERGEDLRRFNGSKYVQSDMGDSFPEIERYLKSGKQVCFSGTPCQVEGLKRYLGIDYPNLRTVDFVCHGVPSPDVWKLYAASEKRKLAEAHTASGQPSGPPNLLTVDVVCRGVPSPEVLKQWLNIEQSKVRSPIEDVAFRDKRPYGYAYSQFTLTTEKDGVLYRGGVDSNPYMRSFFGNANARPSCFRCPFRGKYRNSDITMWDCLDIRQFDRNLDANGTTRVLIHSKRGLDWLQASAPSLRIVPIDAEKATGGVAEMREDKVVSHNRKMLFDSLHSDEKQPKIDESGQNGLKLCAWGGVEAMNKEFERTFARLYPVTIQVKLEHAVRVFGARTGLYYQIKNLARYFIKAP